jgi:hypothetical protein
MAVLVINPRRPAAGPRGIRPSDLGTPIIMMAPCLILLLIVDFRPTSRVRIINQNQIIIVNPARSSEID